MTRAVAQRVLCPGQNGTLKCKVMNSDQIGWTVEGESAVYPGGRNPGADLEGPGGLGGSGPPPPPLQPLMKRLVAVAPVYVYLWFHIPQSVLVHAINWKACDSITISFDDDHWVN